jgi:hypothetical protein
MESSRSKGFLPLPKSNRAASKISNVLIKLQRGRATEFGNVSTTLGGARERLTAPGPRFGPPAQLRGPTGWVWRGSKGAQRCPPDLWRAPVRQRGPPLLGSAARRPSFSSPRTRLWDNHAGEVCMRVDEALKKIKPRLEPPSPSGFAESCCMAPRREAGPGRTVIST